MIQELASEAETRKSLVDYLQKFLKKLKSTVTIAKLQELPEYLQLGPINMTRISALLNVQHACVGILSKNQSDVKANFVLKIAKGLLSHGKCGFHRQFEEMNLCVITFASKFMDSCRSLMPGNEYNEALYALITLESAIISCKLSSLCQPASILRKAKDGDFGRVPLHIIQVLSSEMFLNLEDGEFVTQDYDMAKRAKIEKNSILLRTNLRIKKKCENLNKIRFKLLEDPRFN